MKAATRDSIKFPEECIGLEHQEETAKNPRRAGVIKTGQDGINFINKHPGIHPVFFFQVYKVSVGNFFAQTSPSS